MRIAVKHYKKFFDTREQLYKIQAIVGDERWSIYEKFEKGWLTYDRMIIDEIYEDFRHVDLS